MNMYEQLEKEIDRMFGQSVNASLTDFFDQVTEQLNSSAVVITMSEEIVFLCEVHKASGKSYVQAEKLKELNRHIVETKKKLSVTPGDIHQLVNQAMHMHKFESHQVSIIHAQRDALIETVYKTIAELSALEARLVLL